MHYKHNMRSLFRQAGADKPWEVLRNGDMLCLKSPIPLPSFNRSWNILTADNLRTALSFFGETPFSLYHDAQKTMEPEVKTYFRLSHHHTEMTSALANFCLPTLPSGIALKEANTVTDLQLFAKVTNKNFPKIKLSYLLEAAAGMAKCTTTFLAFNGEKAIGTAYCHIDDAGTAGIYFVSVCEEMRGKGVGRALTAVCLQKAKEANCSAAVLYASDEGAHLYKKMGFQIAAFWQVMVAQNR